ncbi:MAG: hypothetical protein ACREMH_11480 [Gemmatimonadales bacterium]
MAAVLKVSRALVLFVALAGFLLGQLFAGVASTAGMLAGIGGVLAAGPGVLLPRRTPRRVTLAGCALGLLGAALHLYDYFGSPQVPGNYYPWFLTLPFVAGLLLIGLGAFRRAPVEALVIVALLGLNTPAAAQRAAAHPPAGSPEAFGEHYVQALREERWSDAAAMMHPEALAELRAMFAPIVTHPQGGEVSREVFGLAEPGDFAATSDTALFAAFLRTVTGNSPEFMAVMKDAKTTWVGHVDEGADITHVVYRLHLAYEGIAITKLDVMSLKRSGSEWRAVLKGDVRGIAEALRRQVGA